MEQSKFYQIKNITEQEYTLVGCDGSVITRPIQDVDKSASAFTIQDAKDGDVLCYKDEISLYRHDIKNCTKQETTFGGFVYYCCYDGKRFVVDSLYSLTEQDKMDIHPATKEQRDTLGKIMTDAGYTFDFEKKELKKIEQKPVECSEDNLSDFESYLCLMFQKFRTKGICTNGEIIDFVKEHSQKLKNTLCSAWSEEDKYTYDILYGTIKNTDINENTKYKLISWLKSLRPKQWKPSEEQMKALAEALSLAKNCGEESAFDLRILHEQLKKL